MVWTALRVFIAALGDSPWSVQGLALAVTATVFIVLMDAELRHERRFLANLGFGRRRITGVILTTIVAIETVVGLTAGLVHLV